MDRRCVLLVALAWASPALAQTPPVDSDGSGEAQGEGQMRDAELSEERARQHFRVGQALYESGRFGEAAAEFRQAYLLSHRATLLYNAYVAFRDAGDLENAIVSLDEYLRREPDAEDADVLRRRLAVMRENLDARMTSASAVAEERRRLEEERMELEREADEQRRRADAAEATIAEQSSPVPWVVGGSGLGILAGAGIAALIANGNSSDAEDLCPNHVCPRDGTVSLGGVRDSLRRPALAADVMLGIGGATLVTGVVLLIAQHAGDDSPVEAGAACGPTGCAGTLLIRF